MSIAILYLIIYLFILGLITWKSSRRESASDYLNSSKKLTAWESSWTTFASVLTGYNFVIGITFAYLYGFWYLMAFVGAAGAFVVLYFMFKKQLSGFQEKFNLFSVGDYFGLKYGIFSKKFINTVLCASLFLFLILQIFVNTQLFSILLDISKISALLLTTGIVCVYLWLGGFKVSIKTDIFQGILILPIILIVFFFPPHFSMDKLPMAFDTSQLGFAIGLALVQFLTLIAQPESFQRIFAAKDSVALKKGLITAFVLIALVAGAIAYLGINFKFAGVQMDPSSLFTAGVIGALPGWLGSLLLVSLVAAFMGTMDSSAFALGVLLAGASSRSEKSAVLKTRYFMLGGTVIAALASLYLFSFLSSVFALISLISIIGTGLLISFVVKKIRPLEINVFLIAGTISFIVGLLYKFITDNPLTALIPSGVGIVVFLIVRFYKREKIGTATNF